MELFRKSSSLFVRTLLFPVPRPFLLFTSSGEQLVREGKGGDYINSEYAEIGSQAVFRIQCHLM